MSRRHRLSISRLLVFFGVTVVADETLDETVEGIYFFFAFLCLFGVLGACLLFDTHPT